jgi:hypothetical protein
VSYLCTDDPDVVLAFANQSAAAITSVEQYVTDIVAEIWSTYTDDWINRRALMAIATHFLEKANIPVPGVQELKAFVRLGATRHAVTRGLPPPSSRRSSVDPLMAAEIVAAQDSSQAADSGVIDLQPDFDLSAPETVPEELSSSPAVEDIVRSDLQTNVELSVELDPNERVSEPDLQTSASSSAISDVAADPDVALESEDTDDVGFYTAVRCWSWLRRSHVWCFGSGLDGSRTA